MSEEIFQMSSKNQIYSLNKSLQNIFTLHFIFINIVESILKHRNFSEKITYVSQRVVFPLGF